MIFLRISSSVTPLFRQLSLNICQIKLNILVFNYFRKYTCCPVLGTISSSFCLPTKLNLCTFPTISCLKTHTFLCFSFPRFFDSFSCSAKFKIKQKQRSIELPEEFQPMEENLMIPNMINFRKKYAGISENNV